MTSARLFFAVSLPETMISDCAVVQDQLRPQIPGAKWTAPDSMHVTLIFLASAPTSCIPELQQALNNAAAPLSPFPMTLAMIGTFGPRRSPRVLWMGLRTTSPALSELHRKLSAALVALGLPVEDRPFHPHITLARFRPHHPRKPDPDSLTAALSSVSVPTRTHEDIQAVHLIESRLTKAGAIHHLLHTSHL